MRDVEQGRWNDLVVLQDAPLNVFLSSDVSVTFDGGRFEPSCKNPCGFVELREAVLEFSPCHAVASVDGWVNCAAAGSALEVLVLASEEQKLLGVGVGQASHVLHECTIRVDLEGSSSPNGYFADMSLKLRRERRLDAVH
jgi:hypothetical protein